MLNHKILLLIFFVYSNYVNCEYLDLREGVKCISNNVTGICINVYNCLKAKTDIPANLHPSICSYDEDVPVVCCTDCFTKMVYDFRDEVVTPYAGSLWHSHRTHAGNKFSEYLEKLDYPCKRYLNTTIAWKYENRMKCHKRHQMQTGSSNGIDFPRDPELIHTVLLGFGEDLQSAQWLCGGSIVSETFILTSANCTSSPLLGSVKFVAIGRLNDTSKPWQSHRVKRIIQHPAHRPSSVYHDIALLEIKTKIQFSEQVAPISIVLGRAPKPYKAVAWSQLGHGKSLSETLDSVSLTSLRYYQTAECSLLFPPQPTMDRGFNSSIQFCFGYKGPRIDVCEGDSGASIHSKDNTNCAYSILGVTAVGRVCGEAGGAALYTRVASYQSWIESVVWPGEVNSHTNNRRIAIRNKAMKLGSM